MDNFRRGFGDKLLNSKAQSRFKVPLAQIVYKSPTKLMV